LQYLDFDYAQIQKLRANPLLGFTYEQALERYKEHIQQEATQKSSHYLEQIEHKKRELAALEKTLAERKQDVDRDEARLQSAATHLEASYEKIVQEFVGFQALLGVVGVVPASPALRPASENIVSVSREKTPTDHVSRPQLLTPAVQNCPDFLAQRLLPALAAWLPDMTFSWAELFHHAVRACKWILVPNPAWALAYQEAMGGTATVKLVQVEPTWLSFADAWQGDVAAYWMSAYQDPTCLHLLLFEDVNRSLVECWARLWLDMLAGFRETLPVEGHPGWPENLRVFACVSGDQAALPLSKTVVQHWAAVSIKCIGKQPESPPSMRAGHVPWHHWQVWGEQDRTEEGVTLPLPQDNDEGGDYQDFGPLARSLTRDLSYLRFSLQGINPDRNVSTMARSIRIEWPQDYLQSPNHEQL